MKNTNGVRKSPISEMAAMLWRNMVIKFDNHPGLAARRIFNSLLGVSSGDETLHLMFDILLETRFLVSFRYIQLVKLYVSLYSNNAAFINLG